MQKSNKSLVTAIKAYNIDTQMPRQMLPEDLIPLIHQIQAALPKLTLSDVESVIGRDELRNRCQRISKWPDAQDRVRRDFIVELSARLSFDWLHYHRSGLLKAWRQGTLFRYLLRYEGRKHLRYPGMLEEITRAAKGDKFDYFISLGDALRELKVKKSKSTGSMLKDTADNDSIAISELLVKYWVSLDKYPSRVAFEGEHHRTIGLCDFSNVALADFCSNWTPDCKSDVPKARRRICHLSKFSDRPVVTKIKVVKSAIVCS